MPETGAPYERVRVLCVRDGKVLLVQHRWTDGSLFWFIPGGGIKAGESIEEAAVREVWEEAGVRVQVMRRLIRPDGVTAVGREHVFAERGDAPKVAEAVWLPISCLRGRTLC